MTMFFEKALVYEQHLRTNTVYLLYVHKDQFLVKNICFL